MSKVHCEATIRYANHELEGEEILKHIAAGKRVTRLGLTWNDRCIKNYSYPAIRH